MSARNNWIPHYLPSKPQKGQTAEEGPEKIRLLKNFKLDNTNIHDRDLENGTECMYVQYMQGRTVLLTYCSRCCYSGITLERGERFKSCLRVYKNCTGTLVFRILTHTAWPQGERKSFLKKNPTYEFNMSVYSRYSRCRRFDESECRDKTHTHKYARTPTCAESW